MSNLILPGGSATISIPATESIAIFCQGKARVSLQTSLINYPSQLSVLQEVDNEHVVLGPYSAATTLVLEANGDASVLYEVGAAPVVKQAYREMGLTGTPVAVNTDGAVSAAAILGGLVSSTTAAGVAGTIPTGAVMEAASEWAVGEGVLWSVINTGGNTFTVTAAASGHTVVGNVAVATATRGLFLTKKTAADTFITYGLG